MPDIPLPKPQPPQVPTPKQTISPPSSPVSPPPNPGARPSPISPPPIPGLVKSPIPQSPRPPLATPVPSGLPTPSSPGVRSNLPQIPKPPMSASSTSTTTTTTTQTVPGASPQASSPTNLQEKPKIANAPTPASGIKKFLPFIIAGIVLLFIVGGIFTFLRSRSQTAQTPTQTGDQAGGRQTVPGQRTQLVYWGLWEANEVLQEVFNDYQAEHPEVEIVYQKQSHVDYRQRLQTAIASGSGPDIFRFHASWTPMLSAELSPMPARVMSASDYQQTFYPVAAEQLQIGGQIVGIPLMYDGIALYYNKNVLETANVEPPRTWTDLRTVASQLTIRNGNGEISRAGLAIGNASNTEHFADIVALLMLQNGADPKDPTTQQAQDALVFYTNFINRDNVWSERLPTSTVAFARGDVAMMFAPSWRAHEVSAINPDLEFGILPVPTLGDVNLSYASYWAEGVNSKSSKSTAAWDLLAYMSSSEVMQKLYSAQAQTRAFGEIYSRTDLADTISDDPLVAPFLEDAPNARGWYLNSYTHDDGLNDNLINYYVDAINALLDGEDVEDVVIPLSQGTSQVLRQYNIE